MLSTKILAAVEKRHLQSSRQKLRLPTPKTPICPANLHTIDNQIVRRYITRPSETIIKRLVSVLFLLGVPALLEDLDDD